MPEYLMSVSLTEIPKDTIPKVQQNNRLPISLTMYLGEELGKALSGKGPKDPFKIVGNGLLNYSESSYNKKVKKFVKKVTTGAVKLFDIMTTNLIIPAILEDQKNINNMYMSKQVVG